jgi:hypothetical protein
MSEYQYYEFQAIDRPLSTNEIRALRAISSRATITPTHFSDSCTHGSLKADPLDLLARYFDVFVYLANRRYRELAFRFPIGRSGARSTRFARSPAPLTSDTPRSWTRAFVLPDARLFEGGLWFPWYLSVTLLVFSATTLYYFTR